MRGRRRAPGGPRPARLGRAPRLRPAPALLLPALALSLPALALSLLLAGCGGGRRAPSPGSGAAAPDPEAPGAEADIPSEAAMPERYYWAYVASDGPDVVSRLRFGPGGAAYEKAISVGTVPDEPDGLGHLAVTADGSHWYLTLTGGPAGGSVWKYETGSDRLAGRLDLGTPPRGLGLTPDGTRAVVTADPGEGGSPATVSLLRTGRLAESARLATCREGRASVVAPDGRRAYSVCRADDVLVEVSLPAARVRRTARVPGGRCAPSALALSRDGERLFVACGPPAEVRVLDRESLELGARLGLPGPTVALEGASGEAPLLVLVDGPPALLLAGDHGSEMRGRIPLDAPRPTALAVTDDGRYAFVAARGPEGSPRSTVTVVDLRARAAVTAVEVPEGATAVSFWRSLARH